MPIINTFDPASAASEAIGSYVDRKRRNAVDAAARDFQQRQADRAQSNANRTYQLDSDRFQHDVAEDNARDAAAKAKAEQDARHQANEDLHQARADALALLKEQNARIKNDRDYALNVRKVEDAFKLGLEKVKGSLDVAHIRASAEEASATIRAAATVQSANIRAGATIQAAGMHEAGANSRARAHDNVLQSMFTQHDLTTRRGQNLNATVRTDQINAANDRQVQSAVVKLLASKTAPPEPTPDEDPKFTEAVRKFVHGSAADRASFLSYPNIPTKTRAYLQALAGVLGAAPDRVAAPDLLDDEE